MSWRCEEDLLQDLQVACSNRVATAGARDSMALAQERPPVRLQTSFGRGTGATLPDSPWMDLDPWADSNWKPAYLRRGERDRGRRGNPGSRDGGVERPPRFPSGMGRGAPLVDQATFEGNMRSLQRDLQEVGFIGHSNVAIRQELEKRQAVSNGGAPPFPRPTPSLVTLDPAEPRMPPVVTLDPHGPPLVPPLVTLDPRGPLLVPPVVTLDPPGPSKVPSVVTLDPESDDEVQVLPTDPDDLPWWQTYPISDLSSEASYQSLPGTSPGSSTSSSQTSQRKGKKTKFKKLQDTTNVPFEFDYKKKEYPERLGF